MKNDRYRATATAYDLYAAPYHDAQFAALNEALPHFDPASGPILDIGAGSGAAAHHILERMPGSQVLALEPSPSMRSLILGRVARYPEWFLRITVRPEAFFEADLPGRLGGAVALGVIGHFDALERQAVLAELAARLPAGAAFLVDLQDPATPTRVDAYEFTAATIGALVYRGIAEGWALDEERMLWRMSYLTLEGDRVLTEETVEHFYYHPSPEIFAAEADAAGFDARRLNDGSFWLLVRR